MRLSHAIIVVYVDEFALQGSRRPEEAPIAEDPFLHLRIFVPSELLMASTYVDHRTGSGLFSLATTRPCSLDWRFSQFWSSFFSALAGNKMQPNCDPYCHDLFERCSNVRKTFLLGICRAQQSRSIDGKEVYCRNEWLLLVVAMDTWTRATGRGSDEVLAGSFAVLGQSLLHCSIGMCNDLASLIGAEGCMSVRADSCVPCRCSCMQGLFVLRFLTSIITLCNLIMSALITGSAVE